MHDDIWREGCEFVPLNRADDDLHALLVRQEILSLNKDYSPESWIHYTSPIDSAVSPEG